MHKRNCLILCLAAPLFGFAEIQITPYFEGRQAALSLTFDDGFKKEVEDAVSVLDPLEIRGTFFLIPRRMTQGNHPPHVVTWEQILEMKARGHEIGTHDTVAEKLHEVTPERLDELVNGSWRIIKERTGAAPISYASPGGSRIGEREAEVILQNHLFLRNPKYLPGTARTMGYGSAGNRKWTDEGARARIEESIGNGEWVIPVIHGIESGYSPFKSKDEFRIHCEWLKSKSDVLWLAPLGVVGNYLRARERFQVEPVESGAGEIRFALRPTDNTATDPEYPLTVKVAWTGDAPPQATQGDEVLKVIPQDGAVLVNVPRSGVPVILRK